MLFSRDKKKCFAAGCGEQIPRQLLMCRPHWLMVPVAIRNEVIETLAAWQEGASPKAYIAAIKRAAEAVAREEATQTNDDSPDKTAEVAATGVRARTRRG